MRAQMEMLKEFITRVQEQGEKATLKMECNPGVKVTKLTEEDDIKVYLTTIEHPKKEYDIQEDTWSSKLALQLVSKA